MPSLEQPLSICLISFSFMLQLGALEILFIIIVVIVIWKTGAKESWAGCLDSSKLC